MNLLDSPFDNFSPGLYLATLSNLAHSDGIHSDEQELLDYHAKRFGVDLSNLPDVPHDLTELPWATRVLVYRDAFMLSLADDDTGDAMKRASISTTLPNVWGYQPRLPIQSRHGYRTMGS